MKLDIPNIGKAFSPRIMARAMRAFDRATMVVVMTCWGGALLVMMFALYTLVLSVNAKRETLEAAAREPSLPRIVKSAPEMAEMKTLSERLQKRFPDIKFNLSRENVLTVSASDVNNFRQWLTVLSYVDTFSPQHHWTIKEFCVGSRCDRATPMKAILSAEKISFSAADTDSK